MERQGGMRRKFILGLLVLIFGAPASWFFDRSLHERAGHEPLTCFLRVRRYHSVCSLILEGRRTAPGASRGRKVRTPQGAMPRNPDPVGDIRGRPGREACRRTVPQKLRPPGSRKGRG